MIRRDSDNKPTDDDCDDDPTMTTSMLRSGVIAGDNGSPELLTLCPAQQPELKKTSFVGKYMSIFWDVSRKLDNFAGLNWVPMYKWDLEILQNQFNCIFCQLLDDLKFIKRGRKL